MAIFQLFWFELVGFLVLWSNDFFGEGELFEKVLQGPGRRIWPIRCMWVECVAVHFKFDSRGLCVVSYSLNQSVLWRNFV
jgi:hypothetical protein